MELDARGRHYSDIVSLGNLRALCVLSGESFLGGNFVKRQSTHLNADVFE